MTTSESACDCDVDLNVANRSRRLAGTALAVAAGHYAARRKHIASRRAHARQVVEHHEDPGRQCGGRGDSARPLRQRASAQFLNVEAPFRRRNDELAIKRRGKRHRSERGHNFGESKTETRSGAEVLQTRHRRATEQEAGRTRVCGGPARMSRPLLPASLALRRRQEGGPEPHAL